MLIASVDDLANPACVGPVVIHADDTIECEGPDHDWAESAMLARLTGCPKCSDDGTSCDVCGNTGLVTEKRRNLLTIEDVAKLAYETS